MEKMNIKNKNNFEQLRFEVDEYFRELPKVTIQNIPFYMDIKKQEYRHVNNPDVKITFAEYDVIELAKQILKRAVYSR